MVVVVCIFVTTNELDHFLTSLMEFRFFYVTFLSMSLPIFQLDCLLTSHLLKGFKDFEF